jgi:hypothetical protein
MDERKAYNPFCNYGEISHARQFSSYVCFLEKCLLLTVRRTLQYSHVYMFTRLYTIILASAFQGP